MNVSCTASPCPTILNSTCVFYEGGNLIYTGILTNDNLQTALEKIDQKFQDAGLGYIFDNGLVQTTPGAPVELGGPLLQNTTITSGGFDLTITGNLIAGAHITTGGTSSDFVKGDGSLDNTSYQPAGNYITALTGDGTASGPGSAVFTLSNTSVIANTYGSNSQVPVFTVDSKGRITGVTNTAINYPSQLIFISGDVIGSGSTGANITLTLNTVNTGVFPSITPLKFSVNGKGLVTGASALTNLDLDAIYGYTPVPTSRTITINGITQNLAANRTWTFPTGGTVSSVSVTSGTGISATVTNPTTTPNITITNTNPDQVVVLNSGTGISVTGTYPNFTIASTVTGGVTSVTASTPLASSGGSTPNITIQQASGSQAGYLSSTDWTTFNNKANYNSVSGAVPVYNGTNFANSNISNSPTGLIQVNPFGLYIDIPNRYSIIGDHSGTVNSTTLFVDDVGQYIFLDSLTTTITSLSGVGTRMVVADSLGNLGTQAIPTVTGGVLKGTAAGTDTYTTTISGVSAYTDGDAYLIRFTNGNTTGCTLDINGLGAKTLYRNNDGALIGGDIWSGAEMLCVYNSTLNGFQAIGTSPNDIFGYVTNADSVTITKGQVVYAFGGTGDRMTVKLANNTSDATSAKTVGVVLSTSIAANQKGFIIMQGLISGLNILPTSTYNDGDSIYLGATAGSITNVKPYAPNHLVYVATVTTASNGNAGRMYVKIQNGYELDELHNVQAQSPALKDTLWYDSGVTPGQWKTASIPTILGYTPFQLPSLTSGSVLFSDGTTIAQNNSNFFWDNTNNRLGIGVTSPISKLNIQTNSIGVSQTDAMGIALVNTTAATNVLNQNSPGIVFQSAAWKTTATASSRQSNWRVISTPATDSTEIEGRLTFENAVGGGAYAAGAPYFYRDRFGNYGINAATGTFTTIAGLASLSIAKTNPANPGNHLAISGNFSLTSGGPAVAINNSVGFTPTSGAEAFSAYSYAATINQTGGANGITRGIYLNPTLTAAADYRSIESTNGQLRMTDTYSAGSGSLAGSLMNLSQTWNTSGNPSAILLNVTRTASGTSAQLMDLRVGNSPVFTVDYNGVVGVVSTTSYRGATLSLGGGYTGNATNINVSPSYSATASNAFVNAIAAQPNFVPSSGSAPFTAILSSPTVNQTGGASGITRGLYVNPTLTSAADFRGIDVTNGSIVLPYTGQSATYAIKTSDYLVNCTSGTFTATLPTAVGCRGKIYIIKNSGAGAITVATTSSQTIDGSTTYSLGTQYKYVQVMSDGANWIITGNN